MGLMRNESSVASLSSNVDDMRRIGSLVSSFKKMDREDLKMNRNFSWGLSSSKSTKKEKARCESPSPMVGAQSASPDKKRKLIMLQEVASQCKGAQPGSPDKKRKVNTLHEASQCMNTALKITSKRDLPSYELKRENF